VFKKRGELGGREALREPSASRLTPIGSRAENRLTDENRRKGLRFPRARRNI
jgi:hypothetical protein